MEKGGIVIERGITVLVAVIAAAGLYGLFYLFYRHELIALCGMPLAAFAVPMHRRYTAGKRKEELARQFRQLLHMLSSALAAGKAVENAFVEAERDLQLFFPAKRGSLTDEIALVNGRVKNGEPIEKALQAFSERVNMEDVRQFVEVFAICKRTGGDLVEVTRSTANLIAEKIEVEQEIRVMTAQKRFEARAMAVVPVALVALLAYSSPDYVAPLYEGIGRLIMTAALAGFALCYWWIKKITDLKV